MLYLPSDKSSREDIMLLKEKINIKAKGLSNPLIALFYFMPFYCSAVSRVIAEIFSARSVFFAGAMPFSRSSF
jgi:hypothetical protein